MKAPRARLPEIILTDAVEIASGATGWNAFRFRHRLHMYAQHLMQEGKFDVADFVSWVNEQNIGHVWDNGRWP